MKRTLLIAILALFAIVMTACGDSTDDQTSDKGKDKDKEKQEEITIEHELGKTKVKTNPKTVVVFDYGALDTLDELGIDVAGVAQQNVPPYLEKYKDAKYENIGSLKEPDFDKLSEMAPDLILISSRQASQYDELSKIGPTVYVGLDTTNFVDSFKGNMNIIGKIFNKEDEVKEKVTAIDEKIASVKEKAEKANQRGLIVLANDDKISAYGPNSRFGLIHDVLGVPAVDDKIEVDTHGMSVSFEYVKEKNPDILYVVDRSSAIGEESNVKQVVENKLVKSTDAFKNDKIVYLDPYYWYLSGGGLQSVSEMVDEIGNSFK